ncbi:MAG TPA: tRNA (N6-threonylcarbamoyladenosine(37)-N6)-methyltransferase TrmO [Verrucomicrobiae bacterium]|nr:tRNA (N6-threonylcarbamoyladenosine(37)-N6)-methyltransferase TrmO [Verrucomicrobiae bacterium]
MVGSAHALLGLALLWALPLAAGEGKPGFPQATPAKSVAAAKLETDDTMEKTILLRPIGIVHSPYLDAKGTPIQGIFGDQMEAWVEVQAKYVEGFRDLDGFSHAILIYHFHKSDKVEIVGQPYLEKEPHGVFATRSPHRPNHIGLSVVRIRRIEDNRLYFTEVDVLDGTPVLDIKPYVRQFDSRTNAVSGWIEKHFRGGLRPEGKADR